MQALNTDTAFNIRALRQLSDKGCFCILDDAADGCPSMHRLKQASAQDAACFALDGPSEASGGASYFALDGPSEASGDDSYFDLDGPSEASGDASYFDLDRPTASTSESAKVTDRVRLPYGIVPKSSAWGRELACARWSRKVSEADEDRGRLADGWDSTVLREGDTIDRKTIMQSPAETSARSFHPNTWRPQGLIKTAFREIGGCGVSGSHSRSSFVDWTRRRLQAFVTVAGIIQGLFRERAGDLELLPKSPSCRHRRSISEKAPRLDACVFPLRFFAW